MLIHVDLIVGVKNYICTAVRYREKTTDIGKRECRQNEAYNECPIVETLTILASFLPFYSSRKKTEFQYKRVAGNYSHRNSSKLSYDESCMIGIAIDFCDYDL